MQLSPIGPVVSEKINKQEQGAKICYPYYNQVHTECQDMSIRQTSTPMMPNMTTILHTSTECQDVNHTTYKYRYVNHTTHNYRQKVKICQP